MTTLISEQELQTAYFASDRDFSINNIILGGIKQFSVAQKQRTTESRFEFTAIAWNNISEILNLLIIAIYQAKLEANIKCCIFSICDTQENT